MSARIDARVIGLTGNVASGKSTVCELLRSQGYQVIDADAIAREVASPGSATLKAIVTAFGSNVLLHDGQLNRKALGQIVFSDPTAKTRLEAIMHPAIFKRSQELIDQALIHGRGPVFYDAALLFETGRHKDFSHILLVVAPDPLRMERLKKRDQLTNTEALKIMAAQMPQETKIPLATWVLENNSSPKELEQKLSVILHNILSQATNKGANKS
jgi:dephospho-CoA kinase